MNKKKKYYKIPEDKFWDILEDYIILERLRKRGIIDTGQYLIMDVDENHNIVRNLGQIVRYEMNKFEAIYE